MKLALLMSCSLGIVAVSPALAQAPMNPAASATGVSMAMTPMPGLTDIDYIRLAADSDMYEIKSSELALKKSKNPEVRAFAQQMIDDHTKTTDALMAAIANSGGHLPKPPMKLSSETGTMLAQLQAASTPTFDATYLNQQTKAHRMAWSVHKGYADNGADPALKQVAMTAVPIVESHLSHVGMIKGGMSGM